MIESAESLKEALEVPFSVSQYVEAMRSFLNELQTIQASKKGPLSHRKTVSGGGLFCMSGLVAHVDDDEDDGGGGGDAGAESAGEEMDAFSSVGCGKRLGGGGKKAGGGGAAELRLEGKRSGWGRIWWPSGTEYEGELSDSTLHGVGTLRTAKGEVYKGNWILNQKHGFGRKRYANGDVYEGSWKWDLPDGMGRYTWSGGNEYYGSWKRGHMSGRGILAYSSGDRYDGLWLNGAPHGNGVYTWSDGSVFFGTWHRGVKLSNGGRYIPAGAPPPEPELCALIPLDCSRPKVSSPSHLPPELRKLPDPSVPASYGCGASPLNGILVEEWRPCGCHGGEECRKPWSIHEVQEVWGVEKAVGDGGNGRQQRKMPGEMIHRGHRSYDFMLNLQLGMRYSVGAVTSKPKRRLCAADFGQKARSVVSFPREGSAVTPPHPSTDFKWKDYCPLVFRHLRENFHVDAAEYMLSICGNEGLRELSSPGKSGSIFYVSQDERFMIKTLRKTEVKVLLKMLPRYYDHVRSYKSTLLARFYGLHRIKPATGTTVRFVVMGNVVCSDSWRIDKRFDLKGSSQGRFTDREFEADNCMTLKDLDLDFVFQLDPRWKEAVLEQIAQDCKFLESEHIMDYSLLLGVHFKEPPASKDAQLMMLEGHHDLSSSMERRNMQTDAAAVTTTMEKEKGRRTQIGSSMPARAYRRLGDDHGTDEAYDVLLYFGIIDILQEYDMGKKLEHAYKSIQFDSLSISAVDPELYSKRFRHFIGEIFQDKT